MNRRSATASFDEADLALEQALEELDANVPNYNEWLRSLVAPAATGRIIELGAGVGTFSHALLRTADHVVAVEPSDRASVVLIEATSNDRGITAVHGYVTDAAPFGPFDGAVMSNVLEHIDDDEGTLRELRSMLRPGAHIAVFSPAFPMLTSDFDRSVGHVRRYRKADLVGRFERAGYQVVDSRYVNLPGFFAWLLVSKVMRGRPTGSGLSRFYDRTVVPVARALETRVRPPFGQSVLVIGRVPLTPPS